MNSRLFSGVTLLTLALGVSGLATPVTNRTAFTLVKEGDQLIAPQAKDKVTGIHSEKSTGSLVPGTWYIDYYDSTAPFKSTEAKFAAGKSAKITRPTELLYWVSGNKALDLKKLRIDSDRALAIAVKLPDVKNLDLQAAQFWLQRTPIGANWKIRLWAAWPGGVTDVYISANTGEVLGSYPHRQNRS